jgi:hypothetical protein
MVEMKKKGLTRSLKRLSPLILALLLIPLVISAGCGDSRRKVEQIDEAFREGSVRLSQTTAFQEALEEFNFENANFLSNALGRIEASREAAAAVLSSLDELGSFKYKGSLQGLGEYVQEYRREMAGALEELEEVYKGLEEMLRAIEPALKEEAVITQLEAPQSNEEWIRRLKSLKEALNVSVAALDRVGVTALLSEYKALFSELLSTMLKLADDLMSVASGQIPNVELEENPDFVHIQELMASHVPAVHRLCEGLKIHDIDAAVEQVELEINRLYLGEETQP